MREAARNVFLGIIVLLTIAGGAFYWTRFIYGHGASPDFSVFWTAAHVAIDAPVRLYDHAYVTAQQAWLAPPSAGPRPWIYPPSALPLFLPFGLVAFWPAFFVWSALSIIAFWLAWRDKVTAWQLALAMCSPAFVMALTWGQTSILIGAAAAFALGILQRRPVVAGLILGVAAAVKPQVLLMAPIAFVSGGHWRALLGLTLGGLAMVVASLVFGVSAWLEWVRALGDYVGIVRSMDLYPKVITPMGFAGNIGPDALSAATILSPLAGAALAWLAFRREDHGIRLTGLICGSLCWSPYAMRYELAMLAPVAASTLFSRGWWQWFAALTLISTPGWAAFAAAPASLVGRYRRADSHKINTSATTTTATA